MRPLLLLALLLTLLAALWRTTVTDGRWSDLGAAASSFELVDESSPEGSPLDDPTDERGAPSPLHLVHDGPGLLVRHDDRDRDRPQSPPDRLFRPPRA